MAAIKSLGLDATSGEKWIVAAEVAVFQGTTCFHEWEGAWSVEGSGKDGDLRFIRKGGWLMVVD